MGRRTASARARRRAPTSSAPQAEGPPRYVRRVRALLFAVALSGTALVAPKPAIVAKPVPFGEARRSETAAYTLRHYGLNTWRLTAPHVIVEHYTGPRTFAPAWNTFASDAPDGELGERPGTCAHFVIDRDGTIYQLVPLSTICRHTVGLNWTAIGIEHVGTSDASVLGNPRQLRASLRLTLWLMSRYGISLPNVIGHAESLTSRYHRERYARWRCQTHGDWQHADMITYRASLARLADAEHVSVSRRGGPVASNC
jgi:N-acetylmuramoyl-L-alanine amidase